MKIFLCDIDGTVADLTHRLQYIDKDARDEHGKRVRPNWRKFFQYCVYDMPITPVIETIQLLHKAGALIVMMSGRSDEVRGETEQWLKQYDVPFDAMFMRKAGDSRQDSIVKEELLAQVLDAYPFSEIVGIFDDRDQVVNMYRSKGYKVFQVAKGDF
jgi:phosphoglycolate phosphatase-like HAD superfamily hydrolase